MYIGFRMFAINFIGIKKSTVMMYEFAGSIRDD